MNQDLGQPSILLVEDDKHMRTILAARLQPLGARLVVVENGEAALAHLRQETPALVLSDAVMPAMDGFTLCRAVKEHGKLREIPFAILTALSQDIVARSLEAGAEDCISKMEEDVIFRMRVRLLLRLGANRTPPGPGAEVLLLSGSSTTRSMVHAHLSPDGHRVTATASFPEAQKAMAQRLPDAILLDLEQDGPMAEEILVRLRQNPGGLDLPILVLYAKGEEARLEPMEAYIQDALPKPLTAKETRHRFQLLLRAARATH